MTDWILAHLTLQTGNLRFVPAAEVSAGDLAGPRELLDAALAAAEGDSVPMPGTDGWHLTAGEEAEGNLLVFALWPPTAAPGDTAVAQCVCARRTTPLTTGLYQGLRHDWGEQIPIADPDLPTPWLIVELDLVQLVAWPDAATWLGEAERCIAWAWLTA